MKSVLQGSWWFRRLIVDRLSGKVPCRADTEKRNKCRVEWRELADLAARGGLPLKRLKQNRHIHDKENQGKEKALQARNIQYVGVTGLFPTK